VTLCFVTVYGVVTLVMVRILLAGCDSLFCDSIWYCDVVTFVIKGLVILQTKRSLSVQ
jgi:hypothetical protein